MNWVFLRNEYRGKNKVFIYQCVCGNEKIFWKESATKRQKSCGCLTDELGYTGKQRRSFKSRFNSYIGGAKSRDLNFDLTYEEFVEISTQDCTYCGVEPRGWSCMNAQSLRKESPNLDPKDYLIPFNGVDRLDSDKGYTKENCVPCCVYCNRAKSDRTLDSFKDWVIKVYNNLDKV